MVIAPRDGLRVEPDLRGAPLGTEHFFYSSIHMNFGTWSGYIASSTADTSALISYWQPLLYFVITPIFVIGGIVLVVKLILRLIHGNAS